MSKKKNEKLKIFVKIMAGTLAGFTVLSITATCVHAIIELIG